MTKIKIKTIVYLQHDEVVKIFKKGMHYKLAFPLDDVVEADTIIDAEKTYWCQVEQRWIA